MPFSSDAITRLLRDDDPATVALVKTQLVSGDDDHAGELRALLAQTDDATVARHVREVLGEIDARAAAEEFTLLCHFFGPSSDLEAACWLLSRALRPEAPVDPARARLDEWGAELARRLRGVEEDADRVAVLSGLLAGELGFRGNVEDYYAPANSFLATVVTSRRGIPISLVALWRFVAARAGLRVDGINLPGHFIARLGDVLFDPFHSGRVLSSADCADILRRQNLALHPRHLTVADSRAVLVRMLSNLAHLYQEAGEEARHEQVTGWLKALRTEVEG